MSDLERLWDDYPAGKAPVTAILATAAAERRRRRRLLLRPLLTAGVVTGVVGAFVAGTLVDDGSSGPAGPSGPQPAPQRVAFQADLEPATSCDDLLATYVERGLDLVGPYGWGGGPIIANDGGFRASLSEESLDASGAVARGGENVATSVPGTDRQVSSDTGTNVQEAAVDEPDTVKTDGEVLLTVRDDDLVTYDVTGSSSEKLSSIALPGIEDAEILLSGDTVVAIGADDEAPVRPSDRYGSGYVAPGGTRVLTVSLADPAAPEVTGDVTYDAGLLSARQHGSTVRLVLESGLPDLAFTEPKTGEVSDNEALETNRELVEKSAIEDWLPTITADGKTGPLLDCTNVAIPSDELGLDTTSVVGFDAATPGTVDAIGLAGHTGIAYESADHLFLATRSGWDTCADLCRRVDSSSSPIRGGASGTAYLFDFALKGTRATHVASGEVEGAVRDRWSIDEADGVLRLAVGPTSETGNFNAVVTLERSGKELVERGRLDQLGPNEDIKSVRWFDDLAILVTFRRVDPLYAVDLTDTAAPTLLGKLKIPGFSSYLHPLGSWRMMGVGEGPDGKGGWGAQIGLFDVRDVSKVRRIDVHSYGRGFTALAGTDPRAFTWLPDERTVITVLERRTGRRTGYVSVLKLVDGELRERLRQVEYGDDVDLLRAVPMPDGRVVLVTGDEAQFLEL